MDNKTLLLIAVAVGAYFLYKHHEAGAQTQTSMPPGGTGSGPTGGGAFNADPMGPHGAVDQLPPPGYGPAVQNYYGSYQGYISSRE